MPNLTPKQQLLVQILTLWTLLLAAILGAMLLPPTADAAGACTLNWTGSAGTTVWSTAGNWDLNRVPTAADYVCIPDMATDITIAVPTATTLRGIDSSEGLTLDNVTLTLTDTASESHLRGPLNLLNGGSLSGAAGLHLYGAVNWVSGNMNEGGLLTVEPGAVISVNGSAGRLLKRSLLNRGTIQVLGSGGFSASTVTLDNAGTIDLQNTGGITEAQSAALTLNNSGTFRKSGTGEATVAVLLTNTGTVEVSSGTLALTKGSAFTVGSTATVTGQVKLAGNHTWEGTVTGTGLVTSKDATTLTLPSGGYNVPTQLPSSSKLVVAGDVSIPALTLTGGTLDGAGSLTVRESFSWQSGSVTGTGRLILPAGSQSAITYTNGAKLLKERTVENAGSLSWTEGNLSHFGGSIINTGTITIHGDRTTYKDVSGTEARLHNTGGGLITKTGAGAAILDMKLDNDARVVVEAGTLRRTLSGDTDETGEYSVAADAALDFSAGTHNLSGRVTGPGKFLMGGQAPGAIVNVTATWDIAVTEMTTGVLNINAPAQFPTLKLSGNATFAGTAERRITGSMEWAQATVGGTGQLTIAAGATLSFSGNPTLTTALANYGIISMTHSVFTASGAGVITNYGDILLRYNGAADLTYNLVKLINHGTITKDAGTKQVGLTGILENRGTVAVSAGTLALKGTTTDIPEAIFRADAGGILLFPEGTHTVTGTITGSGTVSVSSGKVTFAGPYTAATTRLTSTPAVWTGTPVLATLEIDNGTAQFDTAASVTNLNLIKGYRTGTGLLSVTGTFTWSSGYLVGTGSTEIAGGATGTIGGAFAREVKDGHSLINKGTLNWISGGITVNTSGVLHNNGVLDLQGDIALNKTQATLESQVRLNNQGTIKKSGGTGTAWLVGTLENKGTISVSSGTLKLDTLHAAEESGEWIAQAGGTLLLTGSGNRNFLGPVSGAGAFELGGTGNSYFNGTFNVGSFKQTNGHAYLYGAPAVGQLHITAGTAHIEGVLTAGTVRLEGSTAVLLVPEGRTVNVTGGLQWVTGYLEGTGITTLGAEAQSLFDGSQTRNLRGGHTLNNLGLIRMRTGLSTGQGAVFNNSGIVEIEADAKFERIFGGASAAQWNNLATGVVRKTGGTGRADIYIPFDNDGAVEALAGTLAFTDGNGPGEATGTFTATSTLELASANAASPHIISAAATISGTGTFKVSGGTVTINGAYNVANTEVTGYQTVATFKSPVVNTQNVSVYGSAPTAVFETPVVLQTLTVNFNQTGKAIFKQDLNPVRVDMQNGKLDLTGANMTVSQVLNWTGGTMLGAGTTRIPAGGQWLISGTAVKYLESGHNVLNQGTAVWSGGDIDHDFGPTITNEGLFEVQGDLTVKRQYFFTGPNLQFNNKGTFRKSQGTGTTTVQAGFDNDGVVEVLTGTLSLAHGGGFDETGTFTVNGTLDLAGDGNASPHNLVAGSSITGPGILRISNGPVTIAGSVNVSRIETTTNARGKITFTGPVTTPVLDIKQGEVAFNTAVTPDTINLSGGKLTLTQALSPANITQSGGDLLASGDMTVSGTYLLTGGTHGGTAGTTRILPGAQLRLEGTANKTLAGPRVLRNEGTITYSGNGLYHSANPLLENAGTFDIAGDGVLDGPYSGGSELRIANTGTILKSAGTGIARVEIVLINPGTVRVLSGTLQIDDRFPAATGNSINPGALTGGAYEIAAGSSLRIYNIAINENRAEISLTGPGATFATSAGANALANLIKNTGTISLSGGATLTAGGALANTGTISLTGGSRLTTGLTNQGLLTGSGTVQGYVTNQSQITPGGAGIGTLTVDGSFANQSGGLVAIDLGGTAAGVSMDQLRVTGAASLGGSLAASLLEGYQPAPEHTFQVLVYGSHTGEFASVTGPGEVNTAYNPTDLTLLLGATALTVVSTDPFDQQVDVPVEKTIVVNFSEEIAAGPGLGGVTLTDSETGEPVAATVTVSSKSVFIDPAENLTHERTFVVTVPADAVTAATGLGQLTAAHTASFTTINDRLLPLWPTGAAITATPAETALDLTWTAATDNVGVVGYRLTVDTNPPILTAANSYTLTGLTPDKEYTLKVEARDAEGNWTAASITLKVRTLDEHPPTWTNAALTVSNLGAGSLRLTWTAAADLGKLQEYVVYQNGQPIANPTGTTTSYDVKNLDPETPYTFRVQAKDRVGNESADGPTATATTLKDTTPPAFNSTLYLSASKHTTTTIDLSWTAATDDVRVTGYKLFINDVYYTTVPTNAYQVTGLTPGTKYKFSVLAGDAAGHWTTSGPVLARTATLGDVTPPVWPAGAQLTVSDVGNNAARITWPEATDNTWVKEYRIYTEGGTGYATESGLTKLLTGLTPDTTYKFQVEAVDQAGNVTDKLTATVLTTVDTEAPTWPAGAAITVSNRNETSLRLSWTAANDNVGVTSYRVRMDNTIRDTTGSTFADIKDLDPGATYAFQIEAGDGSGHWTPGPTLTAGPLPDTKAPTWPNGAAITAANVTATAMDLSWPKANDNVKVTEYRLYVNGSYRTTLLPGSADTITYALTNLTPATVYDLKVEAGDAKANWSANGPTATYVTKGDAEAPTWPEGASLSYSSLSYDSVLLTWTPAQDNARVSKYEITANGQSVVTVGPSVTTYLVKNLTPLTTYTFQVKAGDDNNNWTAGGPAVTLTTLAQPSPAIPVWGAGAVLSATAVGETAITLVWPAATDDVAVTEYVIHLNGSEIRRVPGGTLTTTVDGLLADRTYRFKVEANDADSHLTTNGPFLEVTTDDNTPPAFPAGAQLTAENVAAGSLRLTWPAATDNGIFGGYRVLQGQLLLGEPGAGTTYKDVTGLLPNQTYTFTVQARDRAGNWTPAGLSVTVTTPADTTAPTWNPVSLTADTITETAITLNWGTARDDIGVTGYRLFQGGAQVAETNNTSHTVTGLTRATLYNFRVQAVDAAGNWSTTGPSLAIATAGDDVPPQWPDGAAITVTSRLDKSVTISWPAATDNLAVKHYRVTANGQTSIVAATAHTIEGLTPGETYTITVDAVDPSGNQTAAPLTTSVTTTIDPVAPTFPAGSAIAFSNLTVTSLRFDWPAATDNIGVTYYRITVNDQVLTSTEQYTNRTLTGLRPGTLYRVKVEARDAAGNWSQPLTGEVTTPADTTAPTWPASAALTTSAITETAMTLTWSSASDDVGVTGYRLSYGGQSVELTGNTYTVTGLAPATVYTFKVEARDEAGNWSATGPGTIMTTRGDTERPTWPAGSLYLVAATRSSIQLGWTAAADNARVARYRIFMEDAELVTLDAGVNRFTVTGLPDSTAYDFRIEAVDDNGNWSVSGPTLTASTLDVTAPNWPVGAALEAVQVSQETVRLDWSAAADKVGVTGYQVYMGDAPVGQPVAGLSTTVSGLQVLYTYNFRIEAVDAAGNVSAGGPVAQITIADVTAPAWTGVVTASAGETTATFTWEPATDNVGVEGYRIVYGSTVYTTTATTYTFTGLTPSVPVNVEVRPFDGAGNVGEAGTASVTPHDITPPAWPETPSVTVADLTETTVTLSWAPAAQDTVTQDVQYQIYRDGTHVDTVSGTTALVGGLTPYTEYSFTIRPVDEWANVGDTTPAKVVRTLDLTAPVWAAGDLLAVSNLSGSGLTLSWPAAYDLVGVTGYEVFQGAASLGIVTGQSLSVTGLDDATAYTFSVKAVDGSGNWSGPLAVTVTTLDATVPVFSAGAMTVTGLNETELTLHWPDATDNVGVVQYAIYMGSAGEPVQIGTSATASYGVGGLTAGQTYTFTVKAADAAGNWSGFGPSVTVTTPDQTAPVWVGGGLTVTSVTETAVGLTWSGAQDNLGVTGYRLFVDGAGPVDVAGTSYTVTGLTLGQTYTFRIEAVDAAENVSSNGPAVSATTRDMTAPVFGAGAMTVTGLSETALTLHWPDATDNVGVVQYAIFMGSAGEPVQIGTSAAASYGVGGLTAGQTYTFTVKAADAAGNWSGFGPSVTVTTPDQTAPVWVGGGLTVTAVTETTVGLTWSGAQDNLGVTGYRLFMDGAGPVDVAGTGYTVTGLTLGQTYTFRVEAMDAAGNVSSGGPTVSATTRDVTAPAWPGGSLRTMEATETMVRLVWSVASDNVSVVEYRLTMDGATVGTTSGYDMLVSGLVPGSGHTFKVEARDGAGNWSADGPSLTYTAPDWSAPVWPAGAAISASPLGDTAVRLSWPAATDVSGVAGYLVSGNGVPAQLVTGPGMIVEGLVPGATYSISVVAVDPAGNQSTALSRTFAVADVTAPAWPDGAALRVNSVGDSWVLLEWSPAVDTLGVAQYIVTGGPGVITTGGSAGTAYVSRLAPDTEYTFTVVAVDAAGNVSGSMTVTVKTLAYRSRK